MLTFKFSEDISRKLESAIKATTDLSPALATIADIMRGNAVLSFESEIGPDGLRWNESERARRDGGKTLTDKGHLRQSIVAASDNRSAVAGTNLIYAAIHQFGGAMRGRQSSRSQNVPKARVMPARPFLGFSPETVVEIEGVLDAYLTNAFAGGAA